MAGLGWMSDTARLTVGGSGSFLRPCGDNLSPAAECAVRSSSEGTGGGFLSLSGIASLAGEPARSELDV